MILFSNWFFQSYYTLLLHYLDTEKIIDLGWVPVSMVVILMISGILLITALIVYLVLRLLKA